MTFQEYLDEHGNDIYDPEDDPVGECAFCGEPIDRFDDYFQSVATTPEDTIRVHEDCLLDYISQHYKLADIARKMGFEEGTA